MKSKLFSCAVVVIVLVALSATAAQAGGAVGASTLVTAFVCKNINGSNVGRLVSTREFPVNPNDPADLGVVIDAGIRVNNGVLHCRQVNVTDDETGLFLNPPPFTGNQLKCYNIKAQGSADPDTINLRDAMFPAGEEVHEADPPSVLCFVTR